MVNLENNVVFFLSGAYERANEQKGGCLRAKLVLEN